jgi:hypothetical protein
MEGGVHPPRLAPLFPAGAPIVGPHGLHVVGDRREVIDPKRDSFTKPAGEYATQNNNTKENECPPFL